jgi:hypothetical protein
VELFFTKCKKDDECEHNLESVVLGDEYQPPSAAQIENVYKEQVDILSNTSGIDINILKMSKIPKKAPTQTDANANALKNLKLKLSTMVDNSSKKDFLIRIINLCAF